MKELLYKLFLFRWVRVIRGSGIRVVGRHLAFLLFTASPYLIAAEPPSYKGLMRIPIDLVTADGVRLQRGQYQLELKLEPGGYVLSFSSEGRVKAVAKPLPASDAASTSATIPLVGTHYLRPSTEPVLTGEERRFSRTGKTQYEEETRDWKATLRVYKNPAKAVFFIFQRRESSRHWDHIVFKLSQPSADHEP